MFKRIIFSFLFLISFLSASENSTLEFSEQEKHFIAKKTPINYVYDPNWKPFEWKNNLEEHTGIIADILKLIESKSKLEFKEVQTKTWDESVKKVQNSEVMMFSAVGVTQKRKKYLAYTRSTLFTTPYVLVSRQGEDYLDGFADTLSKRVATISSSTIEEVLKTELPKQKFTLVHRAKDGFEALQNKKIDVFVINAATAKYYINILGFKDLKIAYKTKLSLDLRIAIRKESSPEILSIVDKTMKSIGKKEISGIYNKWTDVPPYKEVNWSLYIGVLSFLSFIAIFLIWNTKKLQSMVREKTQMIYEQNTKLENLVSIFNKHVVASKTDLNGKITYVTQALADISGYSVEELLGKGHNVMRHEDMSNVMFFNLWKTIKSGRQWKGEIKNAKKDGSYFWADVIISPEIENGSIVAYNAIIHDITDKKRLEVLSITDALTGTYNRRYFNELSLKMLNTAKRINNPICFMMIDIDYFKSYNDMYGHQEGDLALVMVAKALKSSMTRSQDYCFRLGGEEFGILCTVKDEEHALLAAKKIQKKIYELRILHNSPEDSKNEFMTVSIGILCKKARDIFDEDEMYKDADDMLYKAKKNGRNRIEI